MTKPSTAQRILGIVLRFVEVVRRRVTVVSTRAFGPLRASLRTSLRVRGGIARHDQSGLVSELERLAVMHSRGQLTWSEFGNARAELLG